MSILPLPVQSYTLDPFRHVPIRCQRGRRICDVRFGTTEGDARPYVLCIVDHTGVFAYHVVLQA